MIVYNPIMTKADKLLNEGLLYGYAGGGKRKTSQTGPFIAEETEYHSLDGGVHYDRWVAEELGGGQELAQIGDEKITRVFAGGVPTKKILNNLGLTKKDVTNHLKEFIRGSSGKTRLSEDYSQHEGEWEYDYRIIQSFADQEIPLTMSVETIRYRGTLVFAHGFSRSPIR